jgi:predicted dehydrogenase
MHETVESALAQRTDVVFVLSPTHTHVDAISAALRAGADVLCEKPLASTPEQCDSLRELVTDSSPRVRVAMLRRQFDTSHILQAHLESLVDVSDFRLLYREGGPLKWPVRSVDGFRMGPSAARLLLDVGSHVIDLAHLLFGDADVVQYRDNSTQTVVESDAELDVAFRGGEGRIRLSRVEPLRDGWFLESGRGEVWVPLGPESVIFNRPNRRATWRRLGIRSGASLLSPRAMRPCPTYHEAAHRQLVEFLSGRRERQASIHDASSVVGLVAAALGGRQDIDPWSPARASSPARLHLAAGVS